MTLQFYEIAVQKRVSASFVVKHWFTSYSQNMELETYGP